MHFTTCKLNLSEADMSNIELIAYLDNICCWKTFSYMSNVKFVYNLWQNKHNLGCGHAYGNPKKQSPYCTHTKRSYEEYSYGNNVDYYQFWFLKKLHNADYELGNLKNENVFKIYNSMKGLGFQLLLGQNDSYYNLLDSYDNKIVMFYNNEYAQELNKINNYIVKKFKIHKK